jgi:hypothetical protein
MLALTEPLRPQWRIEQADCLAFLASLPDRSVDVITTDPAYSGMNQHMSFGRGRIVGRYADADNDRWFTEFRDDPATFVTFLATSTSCSTASRCSPSATSCARCSRSRT